VYISVYICNPPIGKTENNLEQHFQVRNRCCSVMFVLKLLQVNHLGHFLICLELLPCMMNTEGDKRIVFVSSSLQSMGQWDPSNLQGEVSYGRMKFYTNSKLYNVSTCNYTDVVCICEQLYIFSKFNMCRS